jgi:hypothetical protein
MLKNTSIRQITGGSILDADYPRKGSIFHAGSHARIVIVGPDHGPTGGFGFNAQEALAIGGKV